MAFKNRLGRSPRTDCFISYHHQTAYAYAASLANVLSADGLSVFWAPKDGKLGEDLEAQLRAGVAKTAHLFSIVNSDAAKSNWMYDEARWAVSKGLTLVPIYLESQLAEPSEREGSRLLQLFGDQYLGITEPDGPSTPKPSAETIAAALKSLRERRSRHESRRRSRARIVWTLVCLIAAGAAIFAFLAEKRKNIAARSLEQILSFQSEVLLGSVTTQAGGYADITVKYVYDLAADKYEAHIQDIEPEAAARVCAMLAEGIISFGEFESALSIADNGLSIVNDHPDIDALVQLDLLLIRADARRLAHPDQLERAMKDYREASRVCIEAAGMKSLPWVRVQASTAQALCEGGQTAEAESICLAALDVLRDTPAGQDSQETARTYSITARVLASIWTQQAPNQRDPALLDEAQQYAKSASEIYAAYPTLEFDQAIATDDLARIQAYMGNYTTAAELWRRSIALLEQSAPGHPFGRIIRISAGGALAREAIATGSRDKLVLAEESLEAALQPDRTAPASKTDDERRNSEDEWLYGFLVQTKVRLQKHDEAERICAQVLDPTAPPTLLTIRDRVKWLLRYGASANGAQHFQKALDVLSEGVALLNENQSSFGSDAVLLDASMKAEIGLASAKLGDVQSGIIAIRNAISILREQGAPVALVERAQELLSDAQH